MRTVDEIVAVRIHNRVCYDVVDIFDIGKENLTVFVEFGMVR